MLHVVIVIRSAATPGLGASPNSLANRDLPLGDPYSTHSARPKDNHTGWNIFGVPKAQAAASKVQQQQPPQPPSQNRQQAPAESPVNDVYKKYRFYKQW